MTVEHVRQHAMRLTACAEARERSGERGGGNAAAAARLRRLACALQKAADQTAAIQRQHRPLQQHAAALRTEALNLQRWRPRD